MNLWFLRTRPSWRHDSPVIGAKGWTAVKEAWLGGPPALRVCHVGLDA